MDYVAKIQQCLCKLSSEARELYLDKSVPQLNDPPSPLQFYRDYVSPNKPVVINNALSQWSALKHWNNKYFRIIKISKGIDFKVLHYRKTIGKREVTVAVTPNGYADAITDGKFVLPEERVMKMNDFIDILESPNISNGIFYIQKQNSNLTDEFSAIINDVEVDISWGTEAYGKKPDAVNFWMGDGRAVTSMHRDHYENLYCVIKGWKKFIMLPPTDLPHIPYETYQVAVFKENINGHFDIIDCTATEQVPWVSIDPLKPDYDRYPNYRNTHAVEVTVHSGQMLYLPSLWFHHVQQSHGCVAVNYWYDMEFDMKYNYYKCVENLVDLVKCKDA